MVKANATFIMVICMLVNGEQEKGMGKVIISLEKVKDTLVNGEMILKMVQEP